MRKLLHMKQLKYILSFLLILLQLSFTNSFASVSSCEKICVNHIEFSEIVKPNSDFSELHFKENYILEASIHELVSFRSISFCDGYAELVEAWEMAAKHADLRTNTTALSKLNDIAGRGRGIDKTKLKAALDGDLGDILNKATGDDLTNILNRLDAEHVTGTHLDEITNRLKTYPELKTDLLDNPEWFETFDDVLQDPGRYWEILSEGNIATSSAMAKWGQGKWWKNLRDLADDFDVEIVNNTLKAEFGDVNVVRQVTLEVTSKSGVKKTIRIDNLALDDISGKYVLGDAKFTTKTKDWNADWLSSCTDNQKDVFKWFENSDVQDIVVKATDSKKIDALDNINLKPDSKIDFNSTNLRLYGSDANQQSVKTIVNIK